MSSFGILARVPFFFLSVIVLFAVEANAEPFDYFAPTDIVYNDAITTPDAFLGFGLGDKPVRHDVMVGYLRTLARQSPRISAETIGFSHEGRPILFFVATSPENQNNIDEIRAAHLARLSGDAASTPAGDDAPAVIWLNYGVHGAESSGMDAAIPTLYHLAAAQGDDIEKTLRETVVVIVAVFNPDGHARRIDHVYTYSGEAAVTDPQHAQHNLWIEARTNHYWFDLNRDWLLLTQPESQAWIKKWHAWKPNVSADFHEMGSQNTYYFHPGEPRRRNPLVPDRARALLGAIADEHIAWLDENSELYTSEEGFDNFYIGKGSTYPSVNGSVGILFEAAAARGGKIETDNGLRSYAQNIRIHFNTSLSTIRGGRENRRALLEYQSSFFRDALRAGRRAPARAYVFTTNGDEARLDRFLRLLALHDIDAFTLTEELRLGDRSFPAGRSFVVPTAQRQFTLIRGLFEQFTAFEEDIFYDVSGWTMPLSYDLDYAPIAGADFRAGLLGERARSAKPAKKAPTRSDYGYLFDWQDYYAPRALHRFLRAGAYARVLIQSKEIKVEGSRRAFAQGSIFVPLSGQKLDAEKLFEIAQRAAEHDHVDIFGVDSGDASAGVGDLGGGGQVRSIREPKVLLAFDDGVERYGAGQLWHLLDKRMHIPVSLLPKQRLIDADLTKYTHIIIPGGEDAAPDEAIGERLGKWIEAGGVLLATKHAAIWAQAAYLSDHVIKTSDEPKRQVGDADSAPRRYDYGEKQRRDAEDLVAGALYAGDLDVSHPVGFGFTDRNVASMRAMSDVLMTPKDPFAAVAVYWEDPLLSGYSSARRLEEIGGTPLVTANRHGAGSIILFADDPAFRATFPSGDRLFLNAIFFGKVFDGPSQGDAYDDH